MSLMRLFKSIAILPLRRKARIETIGTEDQWGVLEGSLTQDSFIVSAGVGKSITFEQAIVRNFQATIILLDPSPTGINTISLIGNEDGYLDFRPIGLAAQTGSLHFGRPDIESEGSFRKGNANDGLKLNCVSLKHLLDAEKRDHIDLLKLDVEGFEYEILLSALRSKITIDQICVEIHTNRVITIDETIFSALWLLIRLRLSGYAIVYNRNMDFTFVHRRLLSSAKSH
jgi:FkbM family methyltransferase